jgi:hypothetical protein
VASVVVNSNITAPLFVGAHCFPAVFSVGEQPFLSVSSIPKTPSQSPLRMVRQAARRFRRLFWSSDTDEEQPIHNATTQCELQDGVRIARAVEPSADGRWLAVTDTQGRVTIVDGVFGHITNVVKGMRDAQVAWDPANCLLIYAPVREIIVACAAPFGDIFDAVKVDKGGRLYPFIAPDRRLRAAFVDSKGWVMAISVERPPRANPPPPPPAPTVRFPDRVDPPEPRRPPPAPEHHGGTSE